MKSILTPFFVLILIGCDLSERNSNEVKTLPRNIDSVLLIDDIAKQRVDPNKVLHGFWYTDGNEGTVPNWIEFDSTSSEYYTWRAEDVWGDQLSGSYKVLNNSDLELFNEEYNDIRRYAFDSISSNYFDLSPYGPSAGNSVYVKIRYEPVLDFSKFRKIYTQIALDKTGATYSFKTNTNSLTATNCIYIEGTSDCDKVVEIEFLSLLDGNMVFKRANSKGDTIPTWTFMEDRISVLDYDKYLDAWYTTEYIHTPEEGE